MRVTALTIRLLRRVAGLLTLAALAVPSVASADQYVRSWAAAIHEPVTDPRAAPPDLTDRTIRQVVRISTGGKRLRIVLSNGESAKALQVGHVEVALAGANGAIVEGSSRRVTFSGGDPTALIPAHAPLVSDPVDLVVPALARVTVSVHLPVGGTDFATHRNAVATGWIAPGDQAAATTLEGAQRFGMRLMLAAVDTVAAKKSRTIVTYGDSITDGSRATVDSDNRWPDELAERVQAAGMKDVAVANAGIGGNRLLKDGYGDNALSRFDRDVLAVPGVSHVVILEGVNDIGAAWRDKQTETVSADGIIDAYQQMIARAHGRGVKVILGTILPYKGAGYWSEWGENIRSDVNTWIRTQKVADGVVDFDAATRSTEDPAVMNKAFDGGDFLHPNDAGFAAMAAAVDLNLLR